MKRNRSSRWLLLARWAPVLVGGTALQLNLSGCDPTVRETVLTGIQTAMTSLVTSVIQAFFLSLQPSSSTTQGVVKAAFDHMSGWLA
jgi:hypothetical protein